MTLSRFPSSQAGTTLVETLVTASIIAAFFGAIFQMNAFCLRYINAGKENVAALQGVQSRLETLRNLMFDDRNGNTELNNATYLQAVLTVPADAPYPCINNTTDPNYNACDPNINSSDFVKNKVTETVTLSDFSNGRVIVTYTRLPGANVTPTYTPSNPNFNNVTVIKANVMFSWTTTFGRTMSEQTETIISAGNKK
jgi:hypothetical protein